MSSSLLRFRSFVSSLADSLRAALPAAGREMAEYLGELIAGDMLPGSPVSPPQHRSGVPGALQIGSGRLARSWLIGAGSGDTVYSLEVRHGKLTISLGSRTPYAAIQNTGGVIPPTDRLRRFLLDMVAQTRGKDDFWTKMLGRVSRGAPIVVKPARYLDTPLALFAQSAPERAKQIFLRVSAGAP